MSSSTRPSSADCLICNKHRLRDAAQGGILYEDDLVYVGHIHTLRGPAAYRGWLTLEPKRHVPGLDGLTDDEATDIGRLMSRVARALRDALDAEHVYAFVFGDDVPHLHVHLVPRYAGTPIEY